MIRFITEHRDRRSRTHLAGLRPAVQGFLTSGGHRAAVRPSHSTRKLRDEFLAPEVMQLNAENYGVCGRQKMHALMRRPVDIGRVCMGA